MREKKKIAIIMGGYSSEYEISIKSGNVVFAKLDRELYDPYRIVIDRKRWFLIGDNGAELPVNRENFSVKIGNEILFFDCVFNAIHGTPGEDGLLQAYFELLDLPHTSCNYYQAALTFNKRDLLSVLKAYGIPSAKSYYLDKGQEINTESILNRVGLPCFVKANRSGSSFGISLVNEASELHAAIEVAFKEDHQILIESALSGTEISVGVMRYRGAITVLPITELVSENAFFDYEAKYLGKSQEITPARITAETAERVRKLATIMYQVLGLKGYSRSEFILVDGEPHLL
ncbi:MAG: hypothetical protein RLZZ241_2279, partial [Bacteroidota bacterium]